MSRRANLTTKVLKVLAEGPATVRDIADVVGRSPKSAHGIVAYLMEKGVVTQGHLAPWPRCEECGQHRPGTRPRFYRLVETQGRAE